MGGQVISICGLQEDLDERKKDSLFSQQLTKSRETLKPKTDHQDTQNVDSENDLDNKVEDHVKLSRKDFIKELLLNKYQMKTNEAVKVFIENLASYIVLIILDQQPAKLNFTDKHFRNFIQPDLAVYELQYIKTLFEPLKLEEEKMEELHKYIIQLREGDHAKKERQNVLNTIIKGGIISYIYPRENLTSDYYDRVAHYFLKIDWNNEHQFATDIPEEQEIVRDGKIQSERVSMEHDHKYSEGQLKKDETILEIMNIAEIKVLRQIPWRDYNTKLLCKHYNLILNSQEDKDKENRGIILQIADAILDYYTDHEDTSDIDDPALTELVSLASIKNSDIYHKLLVKVIADIKNDPFLEVFKINMIASIILYLVVVDEKEKDAYCKPDALKSMLDLLSNSLSKMLVTEDSRDLQDLFDVFNFLLKVMVCTGVKGVKSSDSDAITGKLAIFKLSKAQIGYQQLGGQVADISLDIKARYAEMMIGSLGGVGSEEFQGKLDDIQAKLMPLLSIAMGVFTMDTSAIISGVTDIAKMGMDMYAAEREGKWFDQVDSVKSLVKDDFQEFKKVFFDNQLHKGQEVTYYIVCEIDKLIRNRGSNYDIRREAIYMLKAIHDNEFKGRDANFKNTEAIKVLIAKKLFYLSNMPTDKIDLLRTPLKNIAREIVTRFFPEDSLEFVNKAIKDSDTPQFEFTDFEANLDNKLLQKAIEDKMPQQSFFMNIKRAQVEEYNKTIAPLNLIPIQGDQYHNKKAKIKYTAEGKTNVNEEITHYAEYFLRSDYKCMLIQGGAGTGKSIQLKIIEKLVWKQYNLGETDYIPIFIRLSEIKNYSKCIDETFWKFLATKKVLHDCKRQSITGEHKFLFLFDGFDELKSPKNMYDINKLEEWSNSKMVITSREEYLKPFGSNYLKYFNPKYDKKGIVEIKITDVDEKRYKLYVKKTVKRNQAKIDQLSEYDKEQKKKLKDWDEKKYLDTVKQSNMYDLIKTPYMLNVVINILPELDIQSSTEQQSVIRKSSIYKTFTVSHFEKEVNRIQKSDHFKLPKGLDLETSFYNFSCNLAVQLWLNDRTSVSCKSNNFPFPSEQLNDKQEDDEEEFQEKITHLFSEDETCTLSRQGAQLVIQDGQARFNHKSIMEYFVARTLYEELKAADGIEWEKKYINKKMLKDTNKNQDSEILNFLGAMILDNDFKQKNMQTDEEVDKDAPHVQNKLEKMLNEAQDFENLYMKNILLIVEQIPTMVSKVKQEIKEEFLVNKNFALSIRHQIAADFAKKNSENEKKYKEYQMLAVGFKLGGKYIGELQEGQAQDENGKIEFENGDNFLGKINYNKFEGHGKLTYKIGGYYDGEYQEGLKHGKGKLVCEKGSVYDGDFKEDKKYGEGKTVDHHGNSYNGGFQHGFKHGYGEMFYTKHAYLLDFKGQFKNGDKCGEGRYTYFEDNERSYKEFMGDFKQGTELQKGEMVYKSNVSCKGQIDNHHAFYPDMNFINEVKKNDYKLFEQIVEITMDEQFKTSSCHRDMKIINKTTLYHSGNTKYQFGVITPTLSKFMATQDKTTYKFGFRCINKPQWVGVGVCNLETIDSRNFSFKPDTLTDDAYMISNNGGSWTALDESKNNCIKAFAFEAHQVIMCDLDIGSKPKTITFTNLTTKETYQLEIAGDSFSACILSYYTHQIVEYLDEVSLLELFEDKSRQSLEVVDNNMYFDDTLHHKKMTVVDQHNVQSSDEGKEYRVALMQPVLGNQVQRFSFKKNAKSSWFAIGICHKKIIEKNNYQCNITESNHGFYGISNNGGIWSSIDPQANNTVKTFEIKEGDTIHLTYEPLARKCLILNGLNFSKQFQLAIEVGQDYHICVVLYNPKDEIQYTQPISYTNLIFSEVQKHSDILHLNQQRIKSKNDGYKMSVLQPQLSGKIIEFCFRINKMDKDVAVGLCQNITDENKYVWNPKKHSTYMITSNGQVYHSSNAEINEKFLSFQISKGDIINCQVNLPEKVVTFTNINSNKQYKLNYEGENINACVVLKNEESTVEILSSGKYFQTEEDDTDYSQFIEITDKPIFKEWKHSMLKTVNSTTLKQTGSTGYKFGIIEPSLTQITKLKKVTNMRFGFKILSVPSWLGVGVCNAETIINANYGFKPAESNGSWMVSNNGGTWSPTEKTKNNVISAFTFAINEIIICDLDTSKKLIKFTKEQTGQTWELLLEGNEFNACVLSYYDNQICEFINEDEMKILLEQKKISAINDSDFNFTEDICNKKMKITDNKIIEAIESGNTYRFGLLEPVLSQTQITKFSFQRIEESGWTGFGICHKSIIEAKDYGNWTPSQWLHGFYGISNNGGVYSSIQSDKNNKIATFTFAKGDIINCVYNPFLGKATFTKENDERKYDVSIESGTDYHICCLLYQEKEKVQLLQNVLFNELTFNKTEKSDIIQLLQQNQIKQTDGGYTLTVSNEELTGKHQFAFKMNTTVDWVGFGLCNKQAAIQNKYGWDPTKHQSYMVICNGGTYHATDNNVNNRVHWKPYQKGDVIRCIVDRSKKSVEFTNMVSNEKYQMTLGDESLHACVISIRKNTVCSFITEKQFSGENIEEEEFVEKDDKFEFLKCYPERIKALNKTCVKHIGATGYNFAVMEPSISGLMAAKNITTMRVGFKAITIPQWLGIGICNKSAVIKDKFSFIPGSSQASWIISSNGGSFTPTEPEMSNKVNSFKFLRNTMVICDVDLTQKTIKFTNSYDESQTRTLKIEDGQFHLCVLSYYAEQVVQFFNEDEVKECLQKQKIEIQEQNKQVFQFSLTLHQADMIVDDNNNISSNNNGNKYRFALLEPCLGQNYTKFAFKKNEQSSWFGYGICHKNLMIEQNYAFNPSNNEIFYGVSNNGGVWSPINDDKNDKVKCFHFNNGDTLYGEYDPINTVVKFSKKGSDEEWEVEIPSADDYHICVLLHYANDHFEFCHEIKETEEVSDEDLKCPKCTKRLHPKKDPYEGRGYGDGFGCDICKKNPGKGAISYQCKNCEYDICEHCTQEKKEEK